MNKIGTSPAQKICLLLLLAAGLIIAIKSCGPREPVYEGRPLSSWLKEFETSGTDPDSAGAVAIRSMGTATIPHLLEILAGDEPGIRKKIRELGETLSVKISLDRLDYMKPVTAGYALNVLGTNAEPAYSALTNLFYEQNTVCSAIALAGIGSKGTHFLLNETTHWDPRIRHSAVNALGEARSDFEEVVSELADILTTNEEPLMRSAAASGLGRLRRHPKIAVPALIETLSDKDSNVRGMAIISLGQFGSDSIPALEKLTAALEDPDSVNVELAMRALEKIIAASEARSKSD